MVPKLAVNIKIRHLELYVIIENSQKIIINILLIDLIYICCKINIIVVN
jgi:hypothetical protein